MSDITRFKELFDSVGQSYESIKCGPDDCTIDGATYEIWLDTDDPYESRYCVFGFDESGKYITCYYDR